MRRLWAMLPATYAPAIFSLALLVASTVPASAQQTIGGGLGGYQEVPAISTAATGSFVAVIPAGDTSINFQLSYNNLSSAPMFAHIHFGARATNGGVMVFLCGGGGKPSCPASGTITGSITAADVSGIASQGIGAGEFSEVLAAIRAGVAYANVHTANFGSGEIRGQIRIISGGAAAQ